MSISQSYEWLPLLLLTQLHGQLQKRQPLVKRRNIQTSRVIIFFQPVAVESLGSINASGRVFLSKLGRKLADQSGDDREISFLFQRLSVLMQR